MFPSKYGYAVHVTVTGPDGKIITSTSVPLETVEYGEGMKEYTKTGIVLDSLPFSLSLTLYPSQKAAQLRVVVDDGGKQIGGGTLLKNATIEVKGYHISFDNSVPWTQLMTAYDPGARVVFAGILLALAGQTLFVVSGRKKP